MVSIILTTGESQLTDLKIIQGMQEEHKGPEGAKFTYFTLRHIFLHLFKTFSLSIVIPPSQPADLLDLPLLPSNSTVEKIEINVSFFCKEKQQMKSD
ncbi:hypothetical protein CAEBREN_06214 [Caenorhabditis brenneri]|uniref:Uncharacterized protein n=1 Tax=Caenorhabditis brenneri TaxID=135651 RepID=G0NSJ9_CAEBE|nr:hypothetical protein CAEBREN_06214 [Caenorhabditis brenneri]